MNYYLENEELKVCFNSFGAELTEIKGKKTGFDYMWNAGDAWKRHSPVLFPIVGGIKDKTYRLDGNEYHLNQHGFARDMEFELKDKTESRISFALTENEETLKVYPLNFELEIAYELSGAQFKVIWKVMNKNNGEMYFSIGGHPAFMCPVSEGDQTECYLHFDEEKGLAYNLISQAGLCIDKFYDLKTEDGYVKLDYNFFDNDALIFYNDRIRSVSLADCNKKDYIKVTFDAPVYGIWSAKGKHAPFVCIEPWYGRCDADDFNGTWQERKFGNRLEAGEVFEESYLIEVIE
ncbi:MAG TPA: aldose 1-epimerase family protein [Niallia sp.]|nr:aldose 1-epimerase family protein [Niallia sp.]